MSPIICKNFKLIAVKMRPRLPKKLKKFSLNKEILAGLNWSVIILKFLQILDNYVTYNLKKFQIDCIKIEA